MTFEFSTPEGVPVKCDTIEELVEGYTHLWRNKKKPGRAHGNESTLDEEGIEKLLSASSKKLFMPRHWKRIWDTVREYGKEGVTITELAEVIGRNRSTTAGVVNLMAHNGLLEKSDASGFFWAVPEKLRDHKTLEGKLG